MPTPTPSQPYTIQSGDTFYSIATAAYGAANADAGVAAIEQANPGVNSGNLQIGQQINLPTLPAPGRPTQGQQYSIQPGDTFYSIAEAAYGAGLGMGEEEAVGAGVPLIEQANPGVDPTNLQVGERITIPVWPPGYPQGPE
jgi:N-acetylmuramoyl-L-alanine amidase